MTRKRSPLPPPPSSPEGAMALKPRSTPLPTCQRCLVIEPFRNLSKIATEYPELWLCPSCQASLNAIIKRWLTPVAELPALHIEWRDHEQTVQGSISIDGQGQIDLDVDDDWYSGVVSRADSVALAQALLALDPP